MNWFRRVKCYLMLCPCHVLADDVGAWLECKRCGRVLAQGRYRELPPSLRRALFKSRDHQLEVAKKQIEQVLNPK